MIQNLANVLRESKLFLILSKNVYYSLITIISCMLLVSLAQYHWKRRRLYQMATKRKGPLALPFIGSIIYFLGPGFFDTMRSIRRLTTDYESFVPLWVGSRLYFVIWAPKHMEAILNNPNALEKDEMYNFFAPVSGTGIFTAPVSKWRRHRKIIAPTFNKKILNEFVQIFSNHSEILVKRLNSEVGKGIINVFPYIARCTLDLICESAMGVTVNAQTTGATYAQCYTRVMEIIAVKLKNLPYHFDFIFNRTSIGKELHDALNNIQNFTAALISEKKKEYQKNREENKELSKEDVLEEGPHKRNTFLQQLIELSEKGSNMTDEDIRDEVTTFVAGGSDPAACTVTFAFIMLGMFHDIQDKLYQEVMDVLGPDKPVEWEDLRKLKYLDMVIKETLRLFPGAPVIMRSIEDDVKLEDDIIPGGCSCVMLIIALHRDPKIWPNPLKFDPDRFLPEEAAKRHPYSWIPFSGGPRNCIGLEYAMMVMKTLTATIIRKYRFNTDYKSVEDIKLQINLKLEPVNGYRVSLEPRE